MNMNENVENSEIDLDEDKSIDVIQPEPEAGSEAELETGPELEPGLEPELESEVGSRLPGEIWEHGNGWRGITPNGIAVRLPSKNVSVGKGGLVTVNSPLAFSDNGKTWGGSIRDGAWCGG